MPTIANSNIPAPKGAAEFEDIVADFARLSWRTPNFLVYGRTGQAQDGVDVLGSVPGFGVVAYQCKNTIIGLNSKVILDEALKAQKHPAGVTHLYIATTAPRDTHTKLYAMKLNSDCNSNVTIPVDVVFWEDIVNIISSDLKILKKHYPQFKFHDEKLSSHDKILLDQIINLLARSNTINFLKENDIANGVPGNEIDSLSEFFHQWNTADRTFKDTDMEKLRLNLYNSCKTYIVYIGRYFFRDNDILSAKYLRDRNPQEYQKIIDTLHSMADDIVRSYNELVIAGR